MVFRYESKMAVAVTWLGVCEVESLLQIENKKWLHLYLLYWTIIPNASLNLPEKKKYYPTFCTHLPVPSMWTAASSESWRGFWEWHWKWLKIVKNCWLPINHVISLPRGTVRHGMHLQHSTFFLLWLLSLLKPLALYRLMSPWRRLDQEPAMRLGHSNSKAGIIINSVGSELSLHFRCLMYADLVSKLGFSALTGNLPGGPPPQPPNWTLRAQTE